MKKPKIYVRVWNGRNYILNHKMTKAARKYYAFGPQLCTRFKVSIDGCSFYCNELHINVDKVHAN